MLSSISNRDPWEGYCRSGHPDIPERSIYPFLTRLTGNDFKLNKTEMYEKILESYEIESLVCNKFSKDNLLNSINALPDFFESSVEQNSWVSSLSEFDDDVEEDNLEYINEQAALVKKVAEEIAPIFAKAIANELRDLLRDIIAKDQQSRK